MKYVIPMKYFLYFINMGQYYFTKIEKKLYNN